MVGRRTITVGLVAAVGLWATGCGGGGGTDGGALVEPFEEAAEAAYDATGNDRSEDFNQGTVVEDGCFVLDDEGAVAVAEALGLDQADDAELTGQPWLMGTPGQRESLTCSLVVGDDGPSVGVGAGTLLLDRQELLDEFELFAGKNDEEVTELEGRAPGLDADEVLAVDQGERATYLWIQDDFQVNLTVPEELADSDAGFRALPVLVDAVSEQLSGD